MLGRWSEGGSIQLFLLGAAAHQAPAVRGGLPAPQMAGGPAASHAPLLNFFEAPPFKLSVFCRYQDLGTKILDSQWVARFMMGSQVHDGFPGLRWIPRLTVGFQVHDGFWEEVKAARSAALNF